MSRPTNPQVFNIKPIQAAASQITGAAGLLAQNAGNAAANLRSTLDRVSAAVGTGLNGAAPSLASISETASSLNNAANAVNTALGSVNTVSSSVENIASLGALAGSVGTGLSEFLGGVASAAGAINDAISALRGGNLPKGGESFLTQGQPIKLSPASKSDWRIRLSCEWSLFGQNELFSILSQTGGIVWPYQPQITISTKANYSSPDIVHSNYPFYNYKNSEVDDIQIQGEFSAQTANDADYWIASTTFLKTATKMFFGQGNNAGNPPIICLLNGYGAQVFNNVPVIVKNFSVDLPEDVNYVRSSNYSTWVPIMSNISITVSPIYNRRNLRTFDLSKYARGEMVSPGGQGYI
jgi:hypothetical protein